MTTPETSLAGYYRAWLLAGCLLFAAATPGLAQTYTIHQAGIPAGIFTRPPVNQLLSDNSFEFARPAMSVNFSGQFVESGSLDGSVSLLWLPAPAYGLSAGYHYLPQGFIPHAINSSGHIAGIMAGDKTVAVWTNGVLRNLGKLSFDRVINVDVNVRGVVIGTVYTPLAGRDFESAAFIAQSDATALELMLPGFDGSTAALRMNAFADVVGLQFPPGGPIKRFVTRGGTLTHPGALEYLDNLLWPEVINYWGDIAGIRYPILISNQTSQGSHFFTYAPSGASDLPKAVSEEPNGTYAGVFAINGRGQVLCYADGYFLYEGRTLKKLDDLIPADSGWEQLIGADLNDNGWIVGSGTYNGQSSQAFVMIPAGLDARVSVAPTTVALGENVTLSVELSNATAGADAVKLTQVQPTLFPLDGTGQVIYVDGPIPANAPLLIPGQTATFTYTLKATYSGTIRIFTQGFANNPAATSLFATNIFSEHVFATLDISGLPASIEAAPSRVKTNDVVHVTLTARNASATPITAITPIGDLTLSGSGGVKRVKGPLPAIIESLAGRSTASFEYEFSATQDGQVTFSGRVQGTASGGSAVQSSEVLSLPVTIGLSGDLLIKRGAESPDLYAGAGIYQTVPADPQIATNAVAPNIESKFQVQIRNNEPQPQIFTLTAVPKGFSGWTRTYLLGLQDVTSQIEASTGLKLPLAVGELGKLDVITRAFDAPPGDVERIDFTLALASDPTLTLDAVQAVSQLVPDLVAMNLAWNPTLGGLDFGYTNSGSILTNSTTAKLFWASGLKTNDILPSPAIYTAHIPTGFSDQASWHVAESKFQSPPTNAVYVQLVVDPDNVIAETIKTNNILGLRNTFRHVVLVMMENRSFDHFLGWLPGAEGRQLGKSYTNAKGQSFPNWHLTYFQGCGCDLPDQSFGAKLEFNGGACDGWLRANPQNIFTIGYYDQSDLAFFGQIAPNWTVCDHYFAALMAETQPNRIYQHAAQTSILTNNPGYAAITSPLTLPTIWDRLAATNISARYYYAGLHTAGSVLSLWGPAHYDSISYQIPQFYQDCANGVLPAVSYVDPDFTSVRDAFGYGDTTGNDDHPHSDIRNGEVFLAGIYNAIVKSPTWASTVLIINFDEWGGFFDHVPPPVVPIEPAERALGNDGRLGFRVPCIVISPWSHRGVVKHEQFDHCSVLKLIENRWNLEALTVRDANASDLADVLDLDHPDFSPPPTMTDVPAGPFGGPCLNLRIRKQEDGSTVLDWDATCIKVVLQTATTPGGPWTDQPNVIAPPYVISKAQIRQVAQELMRFKVVP